MDSNDYFKALYSLVTVVNSSLNTKEVYAKIVEHVAKTMQCKACTMRMLDNDKLRLLSTASYGLSDGYMRKGPIEISRSGLDSEVLTGKTIYMKDATEDGRFQYPDAAKKEGLISVISMPLKVQDEVLGILRVYSNKVQEFTSQEKEFLEAVASVCAIAIRNASLYEELQNNYALQQDYAYQIFDD